MSVFFCSRNGFRPSLGFAGTGSVEGSHPCPIPEDPGPHPWAGGVVVTMGLCLWGQEPSGAAEGKDSNSQEGNGPQTDTQGAGGLPVDVTWSTENEPITDLRGKHPDERPVPGGGQMVTRLPVLSPRNVQGNASRTRVCSEQDSYPAGVRSEDISWGRRNGVGWGRNDVKLEKTTTMLPLQVEESKSHTVWDSSDSRHARHLVSSSLGS